MRKRVLIIGGYGVFGSKLAVGLIGTGKFDVIVAGRSARKAAAFCARHGGTPIQIDTQSADFEAVFAAHKADIIIDAAGPFQAYGAHPYAIACAAIACGAHYLDLSDDASFTSGISALDAEAREAGVSILSGVSSVPALSSVVVTALARNMSDIHLIESAILPGNRAPRGLSVIRAILGQVGRDMALWRGGAFETAKAWSGAKTYTLVAPDSETVARRASLIGAPDLSLLPDVFMARSVVFRAGLDLGIMHHGLWALSWLVRLGLMKTLAPLSRPLKSCADLLERFGSDLGGMVVIVEGETKEHRFEQQTWTLIARDGDGPHIPAIPAAIMCEQLAAGRVAPGARPCLGAFSLKDAETALGQFSISTNQKTQPSKMVFPSVLGSDFDALPLPIKDLHAVIDVRRWQGRAQIRRGKRLLSRFAGWLAGFPPASRDIDVEVEMRRTPKGEVWHRRFGTYRFRSHLTEKHIKGRATVFERFGLMRFQIGLYKSGDELHYPVRTGRILGVPLPRFLLPKSETREFVDAEGRACFDVQISLPIAGHVVSYRGWLLPADQTRKTPPAK